MDIPNVGTFYIRRNTAAIAFNDFLVNDVLVMPFLRFFLEDKIPIQ